MEGQVQAPAAVGLLLADILRRRAERVAQLWPLEMVTDSGEGLEVPTDQAEQFVEAVAQALERDDAAPLLAVARLSEGPTDRAAGPLRISRVLRALDAVRRSLLAAVQGEGAEADKRGALERQAPTAFARIGRSFAARAAETLLAPAPSTDTLRRTERAEQDPLLVTIHELRRPTTILSSYIQLLLAGSLGPTSERVTAAVRAMAQATETLGRLIEGLAAVARLEDESLERPPFRELGVGELVRRAAAEVELEAELRGTEIETQVDSSLRVLGDQEDLILALRNLLANAVKHAPAGSPVRLTAHSADGQIHVVVRDQGMGFPAEEAPRLFEKYYRSEAERELGGPGSGLGLFIVATVARRHGGTAQARPAPGGGAEFELILPAA